MLGAPRSRKQMLQRADRQKFLDAEGKEFRGLEEMGTWREVIVPEGTKLLGNMMVYSVKPDGRYKARLVVMGNQVGDDVEQPESSSPTVSRTSVFMLLCLALEMGWPISGFDVTQAYLYGTIPEQYRFHMRVPQGYATRLRAPPGFVVALLLLRARRRRRLRFFWALDKISLAVAVTFASAAVRRAFPPRSVMKCPSEPWPAWPRRRGNAPCACPPITRRLEIAL